MLAVGVDPPPGRVDEGGHVRWWRVDELGVSFSWWRTAPDQVVYLVRADAEPIVPAPVTPSPAHRPGAGTDLVRYAAARHSPVAGRRERTEH